MSAPTKALLGRKARRGVRLDGPRPDLLWVLWLLLPLGVLCAGLRDVAGAGALVAFGIVDLVVVLVVTWSVGGRS